MGKEDEGGREGGRNSDLLGAFFKREFARRSETQTPGGREGGGRKMLVALVSGGRRGWPGEEKECRTL